jgi:UDP-GlcNAc3NAcA epimerase
MKIVTIIGARPQFIKAAAVSKVFLQSNKIEEIIVHTGQHFDSSMSDVFFEELQIPAPKYNLAINSLRHGAMTGRMIEEIEKILVIENPDYALVYGDTNSTIAGTLAAKKLHIKVIHIEAGLRSFNMAMPEEINRIVTDRLSDILFCPTEKAVQNLIQEGFESFDCQYYCVGDVMYDAVLHFLPIAKEKSGIKSQIGLNNYMSCTLHRQETTDNENNFRNVIEALNTVHKQIPVVLPIHPRTRKMLEIYNINPEFKIIDPLGYLDMLEFVSNSSLVITDSGGLQKESYFLKKCCAVVRNDTEWIELIDNGYTKLTGYNQNNIVNVVNDLLGKKMDFCENFYGDGHASEIITNKLLELK